jgi:ribosome-binding factor A
MSGGHRNERLASLLLHEVSNLIRNDIKDPRVSGIHSISRVKLTPDRKSAVFFVSILSEDEDKDHIIEGLNSSASYLRKRLGKILTLKYIPRILFELDNSIENGINLYYKLKDMEDKEKELGWHNEENAE